MLPISALRMKDRQGWRRRRERGQLSSAACQRPRSCTERARRSRRRSPSRCLSVACRQSRPRRAPVECGDLPFLIRRDGTWLYRGSPINRKELVCLFASVLKREADGSFWLETPAERGRIEVEDAPFVAVELDWAGDGRQQTLSFRTNVDKVVTAGSGPSDPRRARPADLRADALYPGPPRRRANAASRRASTARSIMNWSRWRYRNGSAAGACSASGAAASSFPLGELPPGEE